MVDSLTNFLEKYKIRHPLIFLHKKGGGLSRTAEQLIPILGFVIQQSIPDKDGVYWIELQLSQYLLGQGTSKRTYAPIIDAVNELYDYSLDVNVFNQDKTFQDRRMRLLSERVIEQREDGQLKRLGFEPTSKFKKQFTDPKLYGDHAVVMMSILHHKQYAFTWYGLLKGIWACAPKAERDTGIATKTFSLNDILDIFEVGNSYTEYKIFNREYLKPITKLVTTNTDMKCSYKGIRSGRKIAFIEVKTSPQAWQLPMPDIDYMQKLAELLAKNFPTSHSQKMLSDFVQSENNVIDVEPIEKTKLDEFVEWAAHYKIAAGTIRRFVDKNGEQAFEEVQAAFIKNLEDAKIGKAKPVKNKTNLLGAYLRDAIGVKSEEERKSAEERSVKMNLAKEHAKLKEQIKYLEDQKNELQRIHRERCLQIASKLFAGLDKDYEQTLADQFLASMDNDFERRDFEVRRWGALMTMHKIIDFARKQFPRKLPTFASVVKKETGKTLKSLDADIEKLRQKLSDE